MTNPTEEQIARLVDPQAWTAKDIDGAHCKAIDVSLAKARAIMPFITAAHKAGAECMQERVIAELETSLDAAVLAPLEKYRVSFCISQIEHIELPALPSVKETEA